MQGIVPPSVDPRQSSLFAAAWTVGSIKYLVKRCGSVPYTRLAPARSVDSTAGFALADAVASQPGSVPMRQVPM